MNRKNNRLFTILLVLMLALGLLAGCSSANGNMAKSDGNGMTSSQSLADSEAASEAESLTNDAKADSAPSANGTDEAIAVGGGLSSDTSSAELNGLNQKIIYTATLNMQVEALDAAATSLRNAIHQSGGYILQFQDTKHEGEIGSSYTIKVPASGFMSFIDRIEQIKHSSFERNIGGKDVSEEYVDLESRLKARQLVETRLLAMMDKAVKADDLLKFSDQLSVVQQEIERIKGRIRYLDTNVAFSTIELRMYQTNQNLNVEREEAKGLGGRMSDALASSTKVVWDAINLLLVVAAGAVPVLIVIALIGIPLYWIHRKRKRDSSNKTVD
ncbi:uncharacterized lipoprotein YehR (DUF1307 family) [Paenibacillus endophyticus]|uniref:Uncharacterized lipoprotein YehR (DUF1307 family) n=1 Tax=Paenibacillus endophyticus TaxID=1294268 RepID=A0A7W5GAN9_9BACL|nr:DUF4349 domain-containing protein [Paenibacillus endophyticus]MBB3152966.1 uncharacterized lipoprotein YehR (DUF1307 family) [Paenibacillus endophyticus]